jgi:DNA polymerase III sliding clamp (beta) subunit (PCNA family)
VKLELAEPNVLVLRSQTPELGEARIEEDAESVKGEIAIGFNPEFLIDALKVVQGPTVDMDFSGPDRAGCLRAGDEFVYVVMPMSLD